MVDFWQVYLALSFRIYLLGSNSNKHFLLELEVWQFHLLILHYCIRLKQLPVVIPSSWPTSSCCSFSSLCWKSAAISN